ncbi:hypothetical protein FACS1894170_09870 [Planctomycetales bacterium]|nr:hypothetical protein FACS1894170_09870 [Planctomycetales bacterium]
MLYQLNQNKQDYSKVKRISLNDIGWKERDLENLLVKLLADDKLMPIFTERSLQEEPDILALDRRGDLYIFELKRWSGTSENLLQVLRYGQLFGWRDYDALNELYQKYSRNKIRLLDAHKSYFSPSGENAVKPEDFNRKQHFLVVTNGIDQQTAEAIIYWKKSGLNIDAIVYWVFEIEGEYYIEFNTYSPAESLIEYETHAYILNTHCGINPQQQDAMLRDEKAAAYYPGYREKIQKLQKGDAVFLYENEKGIIAYGFADGKLVKEVCDGHPDYEYFMRLEKFEKLSTPISARRIKEIAKQWFFFGQTLQSISEEAAKAILEEIDEIQKQSQN